MAEHYVNADKTTSTGDISTERSVLVGLHIVSSGSAGRLQLTNGGSSGDTKFDMDTPGSNEADDVTIPDPGILFPDGIHVATISNVDSATLLWKKTADIAQVLEFAQSPLDDRGFPIPIGMMPPLKRHHLDFGSTGPKETPAFQNETRFIRVDTNSPCRIEIGSSPVVDDASLRLARDAHEYFGVVAGEKLVVDGAL